MEEIEEKILSGISISPGIAIGTAFFLNAEETDIPSFEVSKDHIEEEILRFRTAILKSENDIKKLREVLSAKSPPAVLEILNAHLEILHDPLLTTEVEKKIYKKCKNIESVFSDTVEEFKLKFSRLEDGVFQERIHDIVDVSQRILRHLKPSFSKKILNIPSDSIIITNELTPSDLVDNVNETFCGFITARGGATSHAAIIARAKGIPFVAKIDINEIKQAGPFTIIIDGTRGEVIINPSKKTLEKFSKLKQGNHSFYTFLKKQNHLKAETKDGVKVRILGNIESLQDVDYLLENNSEGIGLFRSEYLFLIHQTFPSEEQQFNIYSKIAKKLNGLPVVLRIFDIGGEKSNYSSSLLKEYHNEVNPALGCRAIRFLLKNDKILENQLLAILRASAYGNIHILIPMVSDVDEVIAIRKKIQEVRLILKKRNIEVAENIPVGCMIEVPSCAIMSDTIAKEVDFLSIGSNDLIQYVLAADRSNPHMSNLYSLAHPSILRLILKVIHSAQKFDRPLILCGEAAADPKFIPVLLGLGIREFSVAVRHIPLVKHIIRKIKIKQSQSLAKACLKLESGSQLFRFIIEQYKKSDVFKARMASDLVRL